MAEFREQRRADRAAVAQEKRQDRAAEAEQRRLDVEHAAQQRAVRAEARRARVASWRRWLVERPVELMLSLIVLVPGVLAWSAMSWFGVDVYGSVGVLLPLFSEAGMWAFAFARHRARREGRPAGWLTVGLWVFTAVAGVLNFLHGLVRSVIHGLVMAVVAVGGVVAHQLITAAPTRRSVAERRAARTDRIAARRVTAMQRAATRRAVGELDAEGAVRLVHQPGPVALSRGWFGRRRLVPAPVPGRAVGPVDELDAELAELVAEAGSEPAGTAKTPVEDEPAGTSGLDAETAEHVAEVYRAIAAGELPSPPSRRKVQTHLGVRAMTAQAVLRALRDDDGGGAAGVAA